MNKHENTWATYQAAWRDFAADERHHLLTQSVAAEGHHLDSRGEAHGVDELANYITAFRTSAPGSIFKDYRYLEHHDQAIANWTLNGSDGLLLTKGASHARSGGGVELTEIAGFFLA
ncbi:hypothetical protein ACFQ46_02920 [Kineococcus sp. GCM10028916]|uniref:hypothetical protein n=1 Tax=Kineococcus sp. GCM10028916 TaxID=3273394 RepID=UPI003628F148